LNNISNLPSDFNPFDYLFCNPDLIEHFCKIDKKALESHYIKHGLVEGRIHNPNNLPKSRWDYKNVWNKASGTFDNAKIGVAGYTDENLFERSAHKSVKYLSEQMNITEECNVLEIGCGVGRVGKELARLCNHWTGLDACSKMISFAKDYLKGLTNITLFESNGYDLSEISSDSKDKVYCIVVFMHLDEWERYNYIKESYRILKEGGKLLVNNINLCSTDGWNLFREHCDLSPQDRPLNISKTSTSLELEEYFKRAGFSNLSTTSDEENLWITVCGTKQTNS
jgi:ubiquinone/menaquinone biosynthesis C-methylase UbiE